MGTIELTNGDLNNRDFVTCLEKMDNHVGWSVNSMVSFNKVKYRQEKETTNLKKCISKLIDKHAKTRPLAEGEKVDTRPGAMVLRDEQGMPVWEDEAAFSKDHNELMDIKFTLKCEKLIAEDVEGAGLTPREFRACAKIIEGFDNLEDNQDGQEKTMAK